MHVLVINSGSSSVKYRLFQMEDEHERERGALSGIGEPGGEAPDHREALARILTRTGALAGIDAIGHRVVHGGDLFAAAVRLDAGVLERLRTLEPLAPLHNPGCRLGIEMAMALAPGLAQVAVFDTAFHQTMPAHARHYALPAALAREHRIRRYGFHGPSHEYVAARAAALLGRPLAELRLVTLHLGNGASAAAIRGGLSIDTSMGMTPLEGLVMGTRSGDLDPAVVPYLQRRTGLSADEVERLLTRESGLEGMCGTNDMREARRRAEDGDESARLAIAVYCHRVRKYVGAYLAVLGGADAVVFTAGVGENDPGVREAVCRGLEPLGIFLDPERNRRNAPRVSTGESPVAVLVIPTNEELVIARHTVACLAGPAPEPGPATADSRASEE